MRPFPACLAFDGNQPFPIATNSQVQKLEHMLSEHLPQPTDQIVVPITALVAVLILTLFSSP